jgi:Holliday junction DNA helicase RuvA
VISSLNGIVLDISANSVTVEVGGVGYLVHCAPACMEICQLGQSVRLVIHTDVREDAITLYGFRDKLERQVFMLLKTVKGIGSRTALDVISQMSPVDLLRTIGSGDTGLLQKLKGIGKKTAERIVVELKETVGQFATEQILPRQIEITRPNHDADAISALVALGFAESAAKSAIEKVLKNGSAPADTGEFVRLALAFV